MKKSLLVLGMVLLAAGCSTSASQSNGTSVNPNNQSTSSGSGTNAQTYTMSEVNSANSEQKCWTVINGTVYDLTSYIAKHPGGKQNILKICGKDGTQAFMDQHGRNKKANNTLAGLEIGTLKQ